MTTEKLISPITLAACAILTFGVLYLAWGVWIRGLPLLALGSGLALVKYSTVQQERGQSLAWIPWLAYGLAAIGASFFVFAGFIGLLLAL